MNKHRAYEHEGRQYDVREDGVGQWIVHAVVPTARPLFKDVTVRATSNISAAGLFSVYANTTGYESPEKMGSWPTINEALDMACTYLMNPVDDGTDDAIAAMREWMDAE